MSLKIQLYVSALGSVLAMGGLVACGNDDGGSEDNLTPTNTPTSPSSNGGVPSTEPSQPEPTMPSGAPTNTSPASGGQGGSPASSNGGAAGEDQDPSNQAGAGNAGNAGIGGVGNAGGEANTGGMSTAGEGGEANAGGSPGNGGASGEGSGGMAGGGAGGGTAEADAVAVAELSTTGLDGAYTDLSGTATFTQIGQAITLVLELQDCPMGPHISHIHVNPDCGNEGNAAGNHWLPNGELITDYSCGADGTASYTVTIDDGRWTIGSGNADTDVDGRSFMVHAGTAVAPGDRVACGVIEQQ